MTAAPTAHPACDLYAGEHWGIARGLPQQANGTTWVSMWVASAGYGLIPVEARIRPYSATFAADHPDSVRSGGTVPTAWWAELTRWVGPTRGVPRSLAALAATDPNARMLLVLSPPYLAACAADIRAASEQLRHPDQLSILSAGTKRANGLAHHLLPADGRLQQVVGGSRQSLNVRIAAYLLQAGCIEQGAMRQRLAQLLADQPALSRFDRKRMSDAQLIAYIRGRRRENPQASRSRLLRQLRDAGHACEQARFGALFNAVVTR